METLQCCRCGRKLATLWLRRNSYSFDTALRKCRFFEAAAKMVGLELIALALESATFELSRPSLLALTALSTLALFIVRSLRLDRVVRTGLISQAVLSSGRFSIMHSPGYCAQTPGDRFHRYLLVTPFLFGSHYRSADFSSRPFWGCRKAASKRMPSSGDVLTN